MPSNTLPGVPGSGVLALTVLGEHGETSDTARPGGSAGCWRRRVLFVRSAEDKVTADVVARAERFTIPAGWKLRDNIVRREMFLCISTNPCPSIATRWDAGRKLTVADLKALGSTAGFAMTVEGTCTRRPNVGGTTTFCSTSGPDGKYDYKFNVSSPDKSDHTNFVVFQVESHS
jgi:hypothetical protein